MACRLRAVLLLSSDGVLERALRSSLLAEAAMAQVLVLHLPLAFQQQVRMPSAQASIWTGHVYVYALHSERLQGVSIGTIYGRYDGMRAAADGGAAAVQTIKADPGRRDELR